MNYAIKLAFALLITAAACSSNAPGEGAPNAVAPRQAGVESPPTPTEGAKKKRRAPAERGPFEIVLGEWAVTPEAGAVRPGPVTFRIVNRGSMTHGFEIEADGDHSGSGGGDGFKFETDLIEPGKALKVRLDLAPGTYKIECLVEGHDDLGMEGFLEVRPGAGRGRERNAPRSDSDVEIEGFAFTPATIEVSAGTEVTWTNSDPTEHTVTGDGFGSDNHAAEDRFSHQFSRPGVYRYRCAIHPEMTAEVRVSG
jgi:plastocyanin